jgi:hypothetical protein
MPPSAPHHLGCGACSDLFSKSKTALPGPSIRIEETQTARELLIMGVINHTLCEGTGFYFKDPVVIDDHRLFYENLIERLATANIATSAEHLDLAVSELGEVEVAFLGTTCLISKKVPGFT